MKDLKEIIHYIKDIDKGIGLDLDPDQSVIVISTKDIIDEAYAAITNNVTFVCNNVTDYKQISKKYSDLKLVEGNLTQTNLPDKCADFIITSSEIINYDRNLVREELKRVSSGGYSDVLILTNDNDNLTEEFLDFFYAGSGFQKKEFANKTWIFHNPIGFNEKEIDTPQINNFINACEDYCKVIENYNTYSVKDFLYNAHKTLVAYYHNGFNLPDCKGSEGDTTYSNDYTKKNVNDFFKMSGELKEFLGNDNLYWSNFNPYPNDNDVETYEHSLANDLAEIYEDIKLNTVAFKKGNLYDKQEMLWQFRFDWYGHTGDHWSFAVRAIHWKLQDLDHYG